MIFSMTRGLLVAALIVAFAGTAHADSPFSLFGNATAVKNKGNQTIVLTSDLNADTPYGGIAYYPNNNLTFANIKSLSTDYFALNGIAGGSPRFQITVIDTDGQEVNIQVYIGTPPNFIQGPSDAWQSTGNLINSTDEIFDVSQLVGGYTIVTYQDAVKAFGNLQVVGIELVVDGGWFPAFDGVQSVAFDNVTINNHKLTASGFSKK